MDGQTESASYQRNPEAPITDFEVLDRLRGVSEKLLVLMNQLWDVRDAIQLRANPHLVPFSAGAEKPASATHSPRQRAPYHSVSPIFGSAPR